MLTGNDNFKDDTSDLDIVIKDSFLSISYTKTSKLITALYMVTDIVDRGEPIRNKLRHLGAEIISDIHSLPSDACNKIAETVSFLNIASAMNLISEMNCNILKKEFLELNQNIKECTQAKPTWLEEFLLSNQSDKKISTSSDEDSGRKSIGHNKLHNRQIHTRIGVQKGSTLMKALSDKTSILSNNTKITNVDSFGVLKKQRRENIINIIKTIGESATIKSIKDKVQAMPELSGFLVSCSEKTLQRELVSMVKDNVLYKTGDKRWSKYFIKS